MTRERPILFSGEMVRAILEGRKTQTRRVVKPQPKTEGLQGVYADLYNHGPEWAFWLPDNRMTEPRTWPCPHGTVGDRLWVREAWRIGSFMDGEPMVFDYRAGGDSMEERDNDSPDYEAWSERMASESTDELEKMQWPHKDGDGIYRWDDCESPLRWRPSIFMPRWASRITLEITDIRVERVQDITEADAKVEGCLPIVEEDCSVTCGTRKTNFRDLWNSIYAKWERIWNRGLGYYEFQQFPWCEDDAAPIPKSTKHPERYHIYANPWLWVLTFRKAE